jgi:putative PIN family toxin of toxin-antitoxin system
VIQAVLDANVIVASLPAPDGLLKDLTDQWLSGRFDLVISEHIFREVAHAWSKRYWRARLDPITAEQYSRAPSGRSQPVSITSTVSGIAAHPEDDLVIATALSGNASVIVTGDREFLPVRQYEGIEIILPLDFLTRLDEAEAS